MAKSGSKHFILFGVTVLWNFQTLVAVDEHSDFSVSRGALLAHPFVLLSNLEVTACAPIQVWSPILRKQLRAKLKMESIKRRFIQWPHREEGGGDPADLISLSSGPDVRSKFNREPRKRTSKQPRSILPITGSLVLPITGPSGMDAGLLSHPGRWFDKM